MLLPRVGQIHGALLLLVVSAARTLAFQGPLLLRSPTTTTTTTTDNHHYRRTSSTWSKLRVSREEPTEHREKRINTSYRLSDDEVKPIFHIAKGEKEKVINAHGVWSIMVTLLTCPIWMLAMTTLNFINKNIDSDWDPNRAMYDKTGKIWAKTWLTLTDSFPTSSGEIDYLKEGEKGACLYVANHASWLDIPVLCTILDPVFKFIAKGELRAIPCIGQQLVGGDHILIDREDRRSQLRTFKQGISWLQKGVPLMAFPEGKRSPGGRLIDFKGGLFSMAVKTGVPIVPLSISHTYSVMPSNALFPIQAGRGKLHVHVHEPIESTGRTDAELAELVRTAFLSELPLDHQPIDLIEKEIMKAVQVTASTSDATHISEAEHHHQKQPHHNQHHDDSHDMHHITPNQHHHAITHDVKAKLPFYAIDMKKKDALEKV